MQTHMPVSLPQSRGTKFLHEHFHSGRPSLLSVLPTHPRGREFLLLNVFLFLCAFVALSRLLLFLSTQGRTQYKHKNDQQLSQTYNALSISTVLLYRTSLPLQSR